MLIDRQNHDFASLTYPEITSGRPIAISAPETADTDIPTQTLYIQMPLLPTPWQPVRTLRVKPADHKYFLVVASHATRRQAEDYIAARSTEQLEILERDGRFRVYAATGATIEEAQPDERSGFQ